MIIRLGYVAITLNLDNCSTSRTTTLTTLSKLSNRDALNKLRGILAENLDNLQKILEYNISNDIKVYRLTSKLVPFATHPIAKDWDYVNEFRAKFLKVGEIIRENNLRVSTHPDHFTVINTNSPTVYRNSLNDLHYHNSIFEAMELDNKYKLVMHVGGQYDSKEDSIKRFYLGYKKLPKAIKNRIILENDDKIYTISDVLNICQELRIPMVLDVHHHNCNNNGENLKEMLLPIFKTWENQKIGPKIHFSSPKNEKYFRSHADNINTKDFMNFINTAKKADIDFDIMLEAKNKDLALFKLMNEIKQYKKIKIINYGEFEI